jgi:hypothetical protein
VQDITSHFLKNADDRLNAPVCGDAALVNTAIPIGRTGQDSYCPLKKAALKGERTGKTFG